MPYPRSKNRQAPSQALQKITLLQSDEENGRKIGQIIKWEQQPFCPEHNAGLTSSFKGIRKLNLLLFSSNTMTRIETLVNIQIEHQS